MTSRLNQDPLDDTAQRLTAWLDVRPDCDFTIHNLPFGVYQAPNERPRCCSAIGDLVIDLTALADNGYFQHIKGLAPDVFKRASLNAFIALGKSVTNAVRARLREIFSAGNDELRSREEIMARACRPMTSVRMLMPLEVGDYTDFYSSREHASNVGSMLRDPQNPLLPNWNHLPVAYHGRASSIAVSGAPVVRPMGQYKKNPDDQFPVFGPTQRLDYELEVAFVIGKESVSGKPVSIDEAPEYIFGFLLFNDWSARDIQSWEYAPLGPFLSKNFLSTVSPWVVTWEALAPFRVTGPTPDVPLLPYLQSQGAWNFDIGLEVWLQRQNGDPVRLSSTSFRHMYWNVCQQLAHHTVTGCNVRVGDLMASGTVSGPGEKAQGCLMELTRNGKVPLTLNDGSTLTFLRNGDVVTMKGAAVKENIRVGFGEVTGMVVAAREG